MTVRKTYSDFDGNPSSENKIQLMIYSEKQKNLVARRYALRETLISTAKAALIMQTNSA